MLAPMRRNSNSPLSVDSRAVAAPSGSLPPARNVLSGAPAASVAASVPASMRAGAHGSLPQRLLAVIASNRASIIATILLLVIFGSGGLFILEGGRLFGGGAHPSGQVAFVDSPNGPAGHFGRIDNERAGAIRPN